MIPRELGIERRNPPRGRAGCAALRKAAKTYMKELHAAGCTAVILLHDLDLSGANNELAELLDLELCARRCPSFAELRAFVAAQP